MQQQTACAIHGHDCHQGLFSRNLFLGQRIPLAGVAHQNGTIRFGHDPRTSALDVNCRAHEVDNLYVVDGSFFPSSGAVNPGPHDHGQRAARRRPSAGAARGACGKPGHRPARGGRGMKQHLALLALLVAPVLHAQEAQHPWQGKGAVPRIHGRVVRR